MKIKVFEIFEMAFLSDRSVAVYADNVKRGDAEKTALLDTCRAEGKTVDFEAPHGALLWLRDRTKGREEQVFFWRDGRQWFTADL